MTAIKELQIEIAKLKREAAEEVEEFNAGYSAFEDGVPIENEPATKYDVWRIGWVWAQYLRNERMK